MDDEFKSAFEPVQRRRSKRRLLSDDEHRLWRAVVKDARPLSAGKIIPEPEQDVSIPKSMKSERPVKPNPQPRPMPVVARPRPNSVLLEGAQSSPPPLTGLDRRTSQRLARGQIDTEARFDLHGMRQNEAHGALYRFLARSRHEGMRCVLVITGKGESPFSRHTLHSSRFHEATDHSGVLRSALPQWLNEPQFRAEVAGFQPAHPKHGGGGAFYIWLRKRS